MKKKEGSKSIHQWPEDDRPREKMLKKGPDSLSNAELLAILISSGNSEENALDLAKHILQDNQNNLTSLSRLELSDLMKYKGIGMAKAVSIKAALELGKRRLSEEAFEHGKIQSSKDAYQIFRKYLEDNHYERFYALFLNKANNPLGEPVLIGEGGTDGTIVDPKRIMRLALEKFASSLIIAHNHPSGNLQPSAADVNLTEKIAAACKLLDITLLDHLIIGINNYYSFAEAHKL